MERRLAAILAADVVGYTRLLEQDEVGTLAALRERRKGILQPLVTQHQGRIVKLMGDGVLVEFTSAVNAVDCAVELQKRMAAANASLPNDRHIVLRVGINLGDVIVEGNDLYGDGVIIATRLQALAEPGDTWIAANIHDQIEKKLALDFEDLGRRQIKNMARPVHIYRIVADTLPAQIMSGAPAKPSIAVLPFTNMSGDPGQQYFSDGITEDIITELSRFRSLFVIARNSSFQYRDKTVDVRHIARELGVQHVVEGSVRKAGNRLRITAQLIDASTGNHLWADRYDRLLDDTFTIQDDVVHNIAGTLEGRLAANLAAQGRRKPTHSMAAYECVLQAREHIAAYDAPAAEPLLRHAIELDRNYAQAYSWMAVALIARFFSDSRSEVLDQSLEHAQRAVALDDSDAFCHIALAQSCTFKRQFKLAGIHSERALVLNPTDAMINTLHGHWLCRVGRVSEALESFKVALQRDPFPPSWYWESLAIALLAARRYEEAVDAVRHMARLHVHDFAYLAACHAQLGQTAEAESDVAEIRRLKSDFTAAWILLQEPFENLADAAPMLEGMRKAGLPE